MSERARALAARFDQAAQKFVIAIEGLSDDVWRLYCPEEAKTVAALAHHVAWGYAVEIEAFAAIADDRPVQMFTGAELRRINIEHGHEYAECDKTETVDLLRRNAEQASVFVRGLTDAQLARTGAYVGDDEQTVDWWVERVLIGHPGKHLPAIRTAIATASLATN
jgi:hypothetical protein